MSGQSPRTTTWRAWHLVLLLAGTLLAYANSLEAGFVYDDHFIIEQNSRVTGPLDLPGIFQTHYWSDAGENGLYRPITTLTYALNHAAFELRPAGYHATNAALHLGVTVLLYLLLLRCGVGGTGALAAALLFALHPVHTEAVTNVIGRAEVLACGFVLGALLLTLPPFTPNRIGFAALLFLLGLLSKENAIVYLGLAPLLLLAVAPGAFRDRKGMALFAGASAVVVVFWAWLHVRATGSVFLGEAHRPLFVVNPVAYAEGVERWGTALVNLGRYLRLLLVPIGLSADYSHAQIPLVSSVASPALIVAVVALAGLGALAAHGILRRRAPVLGLGVAWTLLTLVPVSNLLTPIGTVFAERFLYLPSVGFCIVLGLGLGWLSRRGPRGRAAAAACLAAASLLYAAGTLHRNRDWKDDETLWRATVRTSPRSAMAHFQLAIRREEATEFDDAIRLYWQATKIYPEFAEAHFNRAGIYRRIGEFDLAIADYRAAVAAEPGFAAAHHNLALTLVEIDAPEDAIEALREAVRLRPAELALAFDLASMLRGVDRPEEAIHELEQVIERDPDNVEARVRIAEIYQVKLKNTDKSVEYMEQARRIDPDHPAVKKYLEGIR